MSDKDKVFKWHSATTIDEIQDFYLSRLEAIRFAAKSLGYAIGLHGSCRRDFDLIAVPWIENPSSKDLLALTIQFAACGLSQANFQWEQKPQGRMATSFPICWTEIHTKPGFGHIDLSVMSSPVQLQPLSDELINNSNRHGESAYAFKAGIKFCEAAHGIG